MVSSTITAIEFASLRKQSPAEPVTLIDVRSPAEFRARHIEFAKNVPLDEIDDQTFVDHCSADDRLYIVCETGSRSSMACQQLAKFGVANAISVEGGMQACQNTDLPVLTGRKAISIERQVRMAAGSLILAGGLLAYFVHPYAIGLSMFIGAGLLFAGITDTCGMGLALARMPWNR